MSLITILLFVEYRFFKQQAEQMMVLKDDYHNHILAINRVLQEYNKNKEQLEKLEGTLEDKKKKSVKLVFPENVQIFSSDDASDNTTLITVNRELEYLKQLNLNYFKEKKLDLVVQRINHNEIWCDYTDLMLNHDRLSTQIKEKNKKHYKKRMIISRLQAEEPLSDCMRETIQRDVSEREIEFTWPIKRSDFWLSSFFGRRRGPNGTIGFHYGIDMAAVRGTSVYAAAPGMVMQAGYISGYGKTVVIAHDRKYRTRYAHLDKILIHVGQKVVRNTIIGKVGSTGYVRSKRGRDASHLHFEVLVYGKKRVNPLYFLA